MLETDYDNHKPIRTPPRKYHYTVHCYLRIICCLNSIQFLSNPEVAAAVNRLYDYIYRNFKVPYPLIDDKFESFVFPPAGKYAFTKQ